MICNYLLWFLHWNISLKYTVKKKKKYSQKQQEVLDNNLLELERAQEGKPSYDACTPKMHK